MDFYKKRKLTIILLIIIIIIGAWIVYDKYSNNNEDNDIQIGAEVGLRAPDFALEDMSGDIVNLSDFRGNKVFLNFWASWCPPCKQEMPDIQKLYKNNDQIKVVTINSQEDKDTVFDYLMTNKYSFTTLLDKNGEVTSDFLVRGIPTTLIIDEDGIILEKLSGAISYEKMLDLISD